MPVDDAQPRDRALTDVLVDHVGLLHAGLRTGIDAVLDLDDGGSTGADPGGVSLRRDFDDSRERKLPIRRQRVLFAVDRRLRDRQLVLVAVSQLQVERGTLAVAGPADLLSVERLAVDGNRRLAAIHRLGEIDLDRAGWLQ